MKKYDKDDSVAKWTKKHGILIEYSYNGKLHTYSPDFLITYTNGELHLIELKGRIYNQEIIDEKNKAAIEYCKHNKLIYKIIYQ